MPKRCNTIKLTLTLCAVGAVRLAAETSDAALNRRLQDMAANLEAKAVDLDREAVERARHFVCAHYMVCYHNTVDFYKQEIELAQRHGIEGFALNCGQWLQKDPKTGELSVEGAYVKAAERLYEAARQLDSGFKLFFSADVNGLRDLTVNMGDMVRRFYDHPNQFRLGDRRVLSAWAGNPATYRAPIEALKAEGLKLCFVPFLYAPNYKMAWSFETVLGLLLEQPHLDGLQYFAADDSVNGILRRNAMGRRVTQHLGKIFMAGAAPAFNSPNLRDFRGLEGYGAMWEGIIRDGADWVELVTWNDYNEDSNLMPFRWPAGQERDYFVRDESYLQATGYYSAWLRSGQRPAITQDKLYVSYRHRSSWLRREWNPDTQQWDDLTMRSRGRVGGRSVAPDQIHDDVGDYVYVTTFLTAPATLTVELGGKRQRFAQPAGIGHAAVPLRPGVPRIILGRGRGAPLIDIVGRKQILGEADLAPATAPSGYHLANRTWTSGAAAGTARRLAAADGELAGAASVEKAGRRQAVRNREVDGSGVTLPIAGLSTGTYNIRVVYSNPAPAEARLTLGANGPPRGENEIAPYIPLFLPPTGKGQFATISFFWSLYSTTTQLKLEWRQGSTWGGRHVPEDDDRGSVLIEAVELIPVEAVAQPEPRPTLFPELVAIPGGTFTMGSERGKPDEGPAHQVTLSPFAIGKYEVTNQEYERFAPEHRKHRDGFSWRDREPVIYVSWFDGVRYCNWLSEQAGLAPSYTIDGNQVDFHPEGEGFRLPSEAEWEYVASGRGENRRYPWGNDEPVPGRHGNWQGERSLRTDPRLPSAPEAGVMVVGSYPAGASRDGIMDLFGNVCEWNNDWFQYYTPAAKTDPHVWETPSPYRSIRGSSWDYYGYPPEAIDREFNHPGFPGYIYIGLRIVLPEAGQRKLMDGQD